MALRLTVAEYRILLQTYAAQTPRTRRQGTRADLGIYVRSGWEANTARYYNWLIARGQLYRWQYEPDTFEFPTIRRGSRFYTPDFKLWDTAASVPYYVEVKGHMDQKSRTK